MAQSTKKTTTKKPSAAKRPAKGTTRTAPKKAPAKKAPAKKTPAKKTPAKKTPAKKTPAKKTQDKKQAPAKKAAAKKLQEKKSPVKAPPVEDVMHELPKPRFNKDGFGYTKDFDLTFIKQQHDALQNERVRLTGQAKRLEDEAHQLVEEAEMGDVQFDDEGGEGDTMVVERERDLALSAQAREAVVEIDAALERIFAGTYGYSTVSGRLLPRERLEAIPWAAVLVEEKVGGIGRR